MAFSDSEREKTLVRKKRKSTRSVGNVRYSDQQKVEAATAYLAVGNLAAVGRQLNIPEVTLRVWKATEWWNTLIEELKVQERTQMSARMKKTIETAQLIVAQRLESGDPYIKKDGSIDFKPVSIRDAHRVSIDLMDKSAILDKLANNETSVQTSDNEKLEKLAERFAEMATKSIEQKLDKRRTVDAVDVDTIRKQFEDEDALHEERQARLQDRVPEISFTPGTNQKPE